MILRPLTLLLLSCCFVLSGVIRLDAQKSKSFENLLKVRLHDMGAIKNGNDVAGYYLFYELDKIDKKNRSFSLNILDENLEEVARKKINQGLDVSLVDAVFNDTLIMFKFYDPNEKKYLFKAYDLKGQKAKGGSRILDKKKYYTPFYMHGKKGDIHQGALFAVPGKGFVHYASVKNEKWGYIIDFLGPTREKSWKYKSPKKDKTLKSASHITANEDYVLSNITSVKNGFGKDASSTVLLLDANTGEKVFESNLKGAFPTQIINGEIDEKNQNITIYGLFYKEGAKSSVKAKSRGIFAYTLDMQGKVISEKMLSWEEDFSEFLPVSKKGKLKGSQYIEFHDFIKTSDGKTLIVGEKYGKETDGAGLATNIIGSVLAGATNGHVTASGPMKKFVVGDLVVFTLDENQNLEAVDVIEKNPSTLGLPAELQSPQLLAYFARMYNGFDYSFTQTNDDNSVVSFTYLDYEDRKGEDSAYILGSISYLDGAFTEDKIELSEESRSVRAFPAIPGYVAIAEIVTAKVKKKGLRKKFLNTLNFRLEKINY